MIKISKPVNLLEIQIQALWTSIAFPPSGRTARAMTLSGMCTMLTGGVS
uniref:Uncharacterized protein n=1 Tax=Moniliophthora roreri TaxID=221103 RepID=A0A0W0GE46_MONRR